MEQLRRITLVDEHDMFTELIMRVLEVRGYRCRVVDPSTRTAEAIVRDVAEAHADMVVANLDLRSAHADGRTVVHALARAGHPVLAVVEAGATVRVGEALALGAHAVATKTMPLTDFLAVVRKTMHGTPVLTRQERTHLVAAYRDGQAGRASATARLASLSAQERAILGHLMAGRAVREVAALHAVSEHTVRTQVRRLLGKLGVSSQVEAVALAWANGWGRDRLRQAGPNRQLGAAGVTGCQSA